MKKIIFFFALFFLFKCNYKISDSKFKKKQIDSTYFVNIYYYGKVTFDSLESKSFLINRNSKYIKQLKFLGNDKVLLDSFFLDKKYDKLKNRILNIKLDKIDTLYWDNKSEGRVRVLVFYDKFKKPIKRINFIGNPEKKSFIIKSIDSFINTVSSRSPAQCH